MWNNQKGTIINPLIMCDFTLIKYDNGTQKEALKKDLQLLEDETIELLFKIER